MLPPRKPYSYSTHSYTCSNQPHARSTPTSQYIFGIFDVCYFCLINWNRLPFHIELLAFGRRGFCLVDVIFLSICYFRCASWFMTWLWAGKYSTIARISAFCFSGELVELTINKPGENNKENYVIREAVEVRIFPETPNKKKRKVNLRPRLSAASNKKM